MGCVSSLTQATIVLEEGVQDSYSQAGPTRYPGSLLMQQLMMPGCPPREGLPTDASTDSKPQL